jgi:hypothetical protein
MKKLNNMVTPSLDNKDVRTSDNDVNDHLGNVAEITVNDHLDKDLILSFFSPKMKRRAESMLSLKCFSWDAEGQLMLTGSPVIESPIADLAKLYLSQFQTCNLKGYE